MATVSSPRKLLSYSIKLLINGFSAKKTKYKYTNSLLTCLHKAVSNWVCCSFLSHRCITGNLAEFVLSPVFPTHRSTIFACHVEPVPRYKIYDIEYKVLYSGQVVNNRSLTAQRLFDSRTGHPESAVDTYVIVTQLNSLSGLCVYNVLHLQGQMCRREN